MDELPKYISWVFHLTLLAGQSVVSDSDEPGFMKWELRSLEKAPVGLPTELNPWSGEDC